MKQSRRIPFWLAAVLVASASVAEPAANKASSPDRAAAIASLVRSLESLQAKGGPSSAGRTWLAGEIERAQASIEEAKDDAERSAANRRLEALLATRRLVESGATSAPVSFVRDVAPVFIKHCQICHGPKKRSSGYRLDTFDHLVKPGDSEVAPIKPGHPDESELHLLITEEDPEYRMPHDADPLGVHEIALIRRWIAQGAKFDGPDSAAPLVSVVPRATHRDPPEAYSVPFPITALAFSPDGRSLAVGGYHEITVWNPADGSLIRRIHNVPERTYALAYSPDGSRLAVGGGAPGESGEIRLFDPSDGSLRSVLGSTADVVFDVAFDPAGKRLAACGADRTIRLFDLATGRQERQIENHADWVMDVAWSPDGSRLASASRDRTAKIFDAKTGDVELTYAGHEAPVFAVAFNEDGEQAISAGGDHRIHVWSSRDDNANRRRGGLRTMDGFGADVLALYVRAGRVYASSADKTVRAFDIERRESVRTYEGCDDWMYCLAYDPVTKRLAAGGFDGRVMIWDAESGAKVAAFMAAPGLAQATQR